MEDAASEVLDHLPEDEPLARPIGVHAVRLEQVAGVGAGGAMQVDGAGGGQPDRLGHVGGLPAHGGVTEELAGPRLVDRRRVMTVTEAPS